MTIEKGEPWGRTVPRPADLRVVMGDAELVAALADGSGRPVAAGGGDLHRTVGGRDVAGATDVLELPIDLIAVTLDDGTERSACASVVVRRPWSRGGPWLGEFVMVMNAEFLGGWHVVARGHPNDGRLESCGWGSDFGVRRRFAARRRLPAGDHVPHPQIETRSFRRREWSFDAPMLVVADGVRVGRSRSLLVEVRPDAATIHA